MEHKDIVNTLLTQGVTAEEFRNFFACLGLQDDPFIVQILQALIVTELTQNNNWNTNFADTLLDNLPGTSSKVEKPIAQNVVDTTSLKKSDGSEFR